MCEQQLNQAAVIRENLKRSALRREQLRTHPQLKYLFFEVTSRCNLSCLHCGSRCTVDTGCELPEEYMVKTLESVKQNTPNRLPMLCITGGEPLLYRNLTKVMSNAVKQGFCWGMTTNATMIDEKAAKALYKAGLSSVTVSIDGLADTHDAFRNTPGAYALAQKGLKALLDHAPQSARVDVITVVHKGNFDQLEAIYRQLSGSGICSWRVVNMEPIGRALQNDALMLDAADYRKLFAFIKEKHFNTREMEVSYGCSHYLTPQYERMLRPYSFSCMAGLQVASITGNGDIVACLDIERRKELVQGNVREDDFWRVWQEKFAFFRTDRSMLYEPCASCADREFCGGDSAHTWDYAQNRPLLCFKELLLDDINEGR